MDKYEYKLKLDEIETLAGEKNYVAAAELADTINWRKVRNVNSLMLVGEIYQQTGRYEDSKELLLMAYDRSPIGKKIIYRLAEIAISAGAFEEAQEYYDEFVEIAPHDTQKYILRYRLSQAKGEPLSAQIEILDELKEQEYTEEWAFELAYLYHEAGMADKCVEACDELILWFGDGIYVERALELKMLYQKLSPEQEKKYQQFRKKRDGIVEVRPDDYLHSGEIIHETMDIPEVQTDADRYNTQNLQETLAQSIQQIMNATEKETVNDTMDSIKRMVEEIPYLQPLLDENPNQEAVQMSGYETDEEIDGSLNLNFQEMLEEEYDGQISMSLPQGVVHESQIRGQMTIEDVLAEWEKTKRAAEAAMEDAQQRKLESAKARALQEAGDIMERLSEVIPQLDAGSSTRELVEQAYVAPTPESVERASRALADANERLQEEIDRLSAGQEELMPGEELIEEAADEPEEGRQSGVRRELTHPALDRGSRAFPDLSEVLGSSPFHEEEEPGVVKEPYAYGLEESEEMPQEEPDDGAESIEQVISAWEAMKDPTTPLPEIDMELFEEPIEFPEEPADEPEKEEEDEEDEPIRIAEPVKRKHPAQPENPEDTPASIGTIKKLDPEMEKRFSYFAKVDGMEPQICQALNGCGAYLLGNSSTNDGNLIIQGASGCGKTMLATNLVKTLQKLIDKPGKQIGKINGDALNHKEVDVVLGKINGGTLIIEGVGDLTRETEAKLSAYLDEHPAEVFVILEDDKDHMEKALSRHEGFAQKFGERILIPFFTNDELVEFAKTYAAENGYGIDAMAVLALYTRISSIQKLDQATTLVEVKEIVDEAIDHVEKGGIKKMLGILTSKRYDENNYVVLREKDFED